MKDSIYINERVGIVPRGYPKATMFVSAIDVTDEELIEAHEAYCKGHNNCSGCNLWASHNEKKMFCKICHRLHK